MREIWKRIPGYEGLYEVSSHGRIKSFYKKDSPRILKQSKTTTGYYKIELYKNGKRRSFKVHRLVGKAFLDKDPKRPNINHIDGDPLNNHHSNLEWSTQRENVIHAIETGLKPVFRISKKRLKELYVDQNKTPQEIADMYKVSRTPIYRLIKKYGIERRDTKYQITEEWLNKQFEKGRSNREISRELECDPSLISHYKRRIEERGYIYG